MDILVYKSSLLLKAYFKDYVKAVFQIENDVRFWQDFLKLSINKYKGENSENRRIFESGFSVYDLNVASSSGLLKSYPGTFEIEIEGLQEQSEVFFQWVNNLSTVHTYNAIELLLIRVIQACYFPMIFEGTINEKEQLQKIEMEIQNESKLNNRKIKRKNNMYIIEFLTFRSPHFQTFINSKIQNRKTSWLKFYEFISFLRNIVVHNGMIVTKTFDTKLSSLSSELYNEFFEQNTKQEETYMLKYKSDQDYFGFLNLFNDFAANSVKFIAGKNNLEFLGFR